MAEAAVIGALAAAIVAVVVARALHVMRAERDQRRGSLPGQGQHRIEAGYWSGGAGGGHGGHFHVPKDPQDYARRFVPRDAQGDADDHHR